MRIIAGKYKGFKLYCPKGRDIRPTTDRIKEDIFNIISAHIEGANFLDLFCGSGAIGIEALSRGARKVTLVEKSSIAISAVKKNTEKIKDKDNIAIVRSEAEKFLIETDDKYDIIFFDPPYSYPDAGKIIRTIYKRNLLCPGGIIIAEQGKNVLPDINTEGFAIYKIKKYSSTAIYFYQYDIKEQ